MQTTLLLEVQAMRRCIALMHNYSLPVGATTRAMTSIPPPGSVPDDYYVRGKRPQHD